MSGRRYRNLAERLVANSVPEHTGFELNGEPSPCWLWIGNLNAGGYGQVTVREWGVHCKLFAHRVSYREFMGEEIPVARTIDHLCCIRHCIHPNHLEVVTRGENSRRAWERRKATGADVPRWAEMEAA